MQKINLRILKIEEIIILIYPILLVTGSALPDLFAVFLCIYFLIFKFKNIKEFLKKNYWLYFFILLWIWFLIVSFFAYEKNLSFLDALIFIRFILFTASIYYFISIMDKRLIKILFKIVLFINCFVIFDTLFQFYNYDSEFGFMGDIFGIKPSGLEGRLSGPFKDLIPGTYLARFYFLIIFLFIINYSKKLSKKKFIFLTIVLSASLSVIYFSGERMALATTLLGIGISIIFLNKIRKLLIMVLGISIFFVFINHFLHPYYQNNEIIKSLPSHEGLTIKKTFNCKEDINKICSKNIKLQPKFFEVLFNFSESAYGEIYLTAIKIWQDNPITGIGLNNFKIVCNNELKYKKYHNNFGCTTHPHNLYIQALVESGIIGFFLFILFVFFIFRKIYLNNNFEKKLLLGIILLVMFWPIMSTGSFLKNWNMMFMCYLIGLSLGFSNFVITLDKKPESNNII